MEAAKELSYPWELEVLATMKESGDKRTVDPKNRNQLSKNLATLTQMEQTKMNLVVKARWGMKTTLAGKFVL